MLSETKTGGVLERGWAHPAGSDGGGVCRAAVGTNGVHAAARGRCGRSFADTASPLRAQRSITAGQRHSGMLSKRDQLCTVV